jgi:hypothetical protein
MGIVRALGVREPFWEKSYNWPWKIRYTGTNLWIDREKSATQEKIFELTAKNPLHRKKYLNWPWKIRYTGKHIWIDHEKFATQEQIFWNWPWKIRYTGKNLWIHPENPWFLRAWSGDAPTKASSGNIWRKIFQLASLQVCSKICGQIADGDPVVEWVTMKKRGDFRMQPLWQFRNR